MGFINEIYKVEENTMKKQLLTLILSMTISAALLTGCGSTAPAPDTTVSETTETGDAAVTDGDSVQDTPDTSAPVSDDHTSGSYIRI